MSVLSKDIASTQPLSMKTNEQDADVAIVDASVLVHALRQVKRWCRDGSEEVVIIQKGTSRLAQRARAAFHIVEAQVRTNLRDYLRPSHREFGPHLRRNSCRRRPSGRPWKRRTVCCARWELDDATGSSSKPGDNDTSPSPRTVCIAVLVSTLPSDSADNGGVPNKHEAGAAARTTSSGSGTGEAPQQTSQRTTQLGPPDLVLCPLGLDDGAAASSFNAGGNDTSPSPCTVCIAVLASTPTLDSADNPYTSPIYIRRPAQGSAGTAAGTTSSALEGAKVHDVPARVTKYQPADAWQTRGAKLEGGGGWGGRFLVEHPAAALALEGTGSGGGPRVIRVLARGG
ncbi:hypothetical protein R3P38DRAFT_3360194 [Favolaschia claudopus]|uniref:PIN domain-containing protein n=1 Tax=Favolaschia claudopus TaxID=2862362 RepID=A0AAW0AYP6_9AGAR